MEGKKAERYDVLVKGTLLYNVSEQTDLDRVEVLCLLSPTLDVKAVEVRNLGPPKKKLKKEG